MSNHGIKVNYLYHSGFAVETDRYLLIFDYYNDKAESGKKCIANGAVGEADVRTEKKVFVFSSHSHGDHYNPVVMEWLKINPEIEYILSSDIEIKLNSSEKSNEKIHLLAAYEDIKLHGVEIKAYGSTDLGISFLVRVDDVSIFHSGDLNWWYWWDDTEEEINKAALWFKDEIRKIKGEKIDIAFFPVDPRLEHNYCVGGEYFIKELKPEIFIPMHFGDKYEITDAFAERMKDANTEVITLSSRGQQFLL